MSSDRRSRVATAAGGPAGRLDRERLAHSLALYAVTDRHWLGERTLDSCVREALRGGATFIQVREKDDMALPHDEYLAEARELRGLCRSQAVPFVVDDDVALALACEADGVHVGQGDMEAAAVRRHIGEGRILGVSANTVGEARAAERAGADYLGVGAVFPTGSKADADVISCEELAAICEAVSIPVVAIGGITAANVGELAGTGICGVAVISAIFAQPDVEAATRELRARVREVLGV